MKIGGRIELAGHEGEHRCLVDAAGRTVGIGDLAAEPDEAARAVGVRVNRIGDLLDDGQPNSSFKGLPAPNQNAPDSASLPGALCWLIPDDKPGFSSQIIPSHPHVASIRIRTVQDLLGHASVETTMIYLHTLKRPGAGAPSPLDLA